MVRVHRRQLEQEPALLEEGETGRDRGKEDPVRVGLLVDEVPDPAELRTVVQLVQPPPRAAGVVEAAPADDRADPVDRAGELEQVIGVLVARGALDEDGRPDAALGQQRLEVGRLEHPGDCRVVAGHPRLRDAARIPEVLMGVDRHEGRDGSRGEGGNAARPACHAYLAFAFVISDVPVSTFFGTAFP
jgi:hypothetical protein